MTAATLAWSALGAGLFVASGLIVAVTVTRVVLHHEHLCDLLGSYPNKSHKWPSSLAVASVALVWICWALALGQLLGALALLRRGPLLVAAVASAAAGHFLSRLLPPGRPLDSKSEPGGTT
ncbi:MAG: hypothetical protein M3N98_03290, partial [Actinomycetota bacterium]|nr:hypothetical protein [Actinomycetota bacterium]